jgi:hypothetical protein
MAAVKGPDMIAQGASQNLESIQMLLAIFVIFTVVFWKTMLKIVIIALLIVIVVLITSGAAALLQHAHYLIR